MRQPPPQDLHTTLDRIDALAGLMDARFKIPGVPWRFGVDSLLGLIPGVGDTVSLLIASYIIGQAARTGAPVGLLVRMVINVLLDWAIGLIPVIGDIFDWAFKANLRNARLLRRYHGL